MVASQAHTVLKDRKIFELIFFLDLGSFFNFLKYLYKKEIYGAVEVGRLDDINLLNLLIEFFL